MTGEQGTLLAAPPDDASPDPEVLRRARQIAARLAMPRPRRDLTARRGAGELASVRFRGGSDDIDLDRTIEQLVEHPVPEEDDIIVRERVRTRRSVVLLADVSGSMRGERVRTAAATVGALASELARDDLAVIAFWSDAAVLSHLGQRLPPQQLLDTMLRIPAKGLTNIAFPLQVAARELARVPARDARVLLLSDCVHNAGPDPRPFAARLPRLDVLLDTSGEQDADLARDLARLGHGRMLLAHTYRDIAPALATLFTGLARAASAGPRTGPAHSRRSNARHHRRHRHAARGRPRRRVPAADAGRGPRQGCTLTDLAALTSPEAAHLADEGALLAVPVAATEQHGPHLPLSTDTDLAVALCARLAAARPDVVVAPPLAYGSSGEHEGFAGTISIGQEAVELVLVELCRSATRTFRRVLLVSTHGGNAEAVRRAEQRLRSESRDVYAWLPRWHGDAHAGRTETSLQLALAPQAVRISRARKGNTTPIAELMPALRASAVRAVSPNGVLGDPAGATAAEGEAVLGALLADLVTSVGAWCSD